MIREFYFLVLNIHLVISKVRGDFDQSVKHNSIPGKTLTLLTDSRVTIYAGTLAPLLPVWGKSSVI